MCKSIEAYTQQTGRCGRDGLPAECIMFWSTKDFGQAHYFRQQSEQYQQQQKASSYINNSNSDMRSVVISRLFEAMKQYVTSNICRRKVILQYFGEDTSSLLCQRCDNCCMTQDANNMVDLRVEVENFLQAVYETGERFGMHVPIDILHGKLTSNSKSKQNMFRTPIAQMKSFGSLSSKEGYTEKYMTALGRLILTSGLLELYHKNEFTLYRLTNTGKAILAHTQQLAPLKLSSDFEPEYQARQKFLRRREKAIVSKLTPVPAAVTTTPSPAAGQAATPAAPDKKAAFAAYTEEQEREKRYFEELMDALMIVRKQESIRLGVPPYMLSSHDELTSFATYRPLIMEDLLILPNVSLERAPKIAPAILKCIRHFCHDQNVVSNMPRIQRHMQCSVDEQYEVIVPKENKQSGENKEEMGGRGSG